MKSIVLLSQKGGSGKSTLTVNLAVLAAEKGPSLIIDRDKPQGTASKWWNRRQEREGAPEMPDLIDIEQAQISFAVEGLRKGEGHLFIDTRPAVSQPEADAARAADIILVPVRASINDVEAIADTLDMVRRLGRQAFVIVNAAKNERRAMEAKASLSRFGVPVCPQALFDRAAWLDSPLDGLGVTELQGAGARMAEAELRKAWDWIEETASNG